MRFEVKKHICTLAAKGDYSKELNLISWNNGAPKYDLRLWKDAGSTPLRGVTLDDAEMITLYKAMSTLANQSGSREAAGEGDGRPAGGDEQGERNRNENEISL